MPHPISASIFKADLWMGQNLTQCPPNRRAKNELEIWIVVWFLVAILFSGEMIEVRAFDNSKKCFEAAERLELYGRGVLKKAECVAKYRS